MNTGEEEGGEQSGSHPWAIKPLEDHEIVGYVTRARARLFFIIACIEAGLALIGVIALAMSIFIPINPNHEVITFFSTIIAGIIGSLTTILMTGLQTAGRLSVEGGQVVLKPPKETNDRGSNSKQA